MKLKLPHRDVILDSTLSYEKRSIFIENLLQEEIEFHSENMTVEEYFRYTWHKSPTKVCMDIIAYYLTKGNADGEDREVLSHKKEKEMKKGSKRHTTLSNIPYETSVKLGIIDSEDTSYS